MIVLGLSTEVKSMADFISGINAVSLSSHLSVSIFWCFAYWTTLLPVVKSTL
jgi:hypothetical protein